MLLGLHSAGQQTTNTSHWAG